MAKGQKANRIVWILSLTLGPVVYCVILLTLHEIPNIEAIKNNIINLMVAIVVCWAVGFCIRMGMVLAGQIHYQIWSIRMIEKTTVTYFE
jgi:hypothetical protein